MIYKLEIIESGVKVTAEYSPGSRCETVAKSFSDAIGILETWYGEDKNVSQWGHHNNDIRTERKLT
jgi:hypothetical protein